MSKILDSIDQMATRGYPAGWRNPDIKKYILTGDEKLLPQIPKPQNHAAWDLWSALPAPDHWTEEAGRVIRLAAYHSIDALIQGWLSQYCSWSGSKWEHFKAALALLRAHAVPEDTIYLAIANSEAWNHSENKPTEVGLELLNATDEVLKKAVKAGYRNWQIPALLAHLQPDRLEKLIAEGLAFPYASTTYGMMARANPERFAPQAFDFFNRLTNVDERVGLITTLADVSPELYGEPALAETAGCLSGGEADDPIARFCCEFLLKHNHPDAIRLTCAWMEHFPRGYNPDYQRELVIKEVLSKSPADALLMAQACTRCQSGRVVILGIRHWLQLGVGDSVEAFETALRSLLSHGENDAILQGISFSRDWNLERMQPDIWPLMQHKSRPVRGAAARALAGLGYAGASERALKLLEHKKADVRLAAVMLLSQIGGEEALKELKQRLDVEENDDVRDSILLALERGGGAAAFSPAEQQARIAKTLAKSKSVPAAWIKAEALVFKRRDGSALTADEVLYLLIRQSRCKEMRADLEAKPLYAELDRASCADSALVLLQAFLGSGQDAADRWVLALAALTGDDRLVPALRKAIIDWADNSRGKLAEYAAQALALLSTDAALMVVDSLSIRFRSKNKNIGQAAADAFASAAEARGVTVEELGDLVVPWLGFEAGKPRLIETSKGQVEARIDAEMKLSFRDVKTGKSLAKLPAGATAEVQAEFKTLTGTLKEAVKAQLLRIETLLVRQFRWPVSRWSELYLAHPLLRPFTQRLVWGWRDNDGVLLHTFRALDDATLTDVEDNAVTLPDDGSISLVHPLDLTDDARAAWLRHLADYDISPTFPQLDRPVVRVKEEEAATKFGKQIAGTALNAMTFRSRAEKLGWSRGSVCDGGGVTSYRKIFTGAGVEAFLALEGMYVGIGMDESITLGDVFFVKSGSVQVGSYTYDEPSKDDDPRLIAFGDVPAVPFSEVMGDLVKISGKAGEAAETPAE